MNAHANIDGLTALRRIDSKDAALVAALAALLRASGLDVRMDGHLEHMITYFDTNSDISFGIVSIEGGAVRLTPERITDAVAALDKFDPLLSNVENALGVSLEATHMTDAHRNGISIHVAQGHASLVLNIPRDHPHCAQWNADASKLPPHDAHMPCVVCIEINGPRLSIAEADNLASGDLLLMPQSAGATLRTAHLADVLGAYYLTTGLFSVGQSGASMTDLNTTAVQDFLVPLTIRLPDRMTSAASLAALVPGTTLALGPLTDGIAVELRIADRLLARGELVQMGEGFAVLIEACADIKDTVATVESD
jgi:flagellar motor switch/type III secretory pathway protein FliN